VSLSVTSQGVPEQDTRQTACETRRATARRTEIFGLRREMRRFRGFRRSEFELLLE
jgi:hypothetical protein